MYGNIHPVHLINAHCYKVGAMYIGYGVVIKSGY